MKLRHILSRQYTEESPRSSGPKTLPLIVSPLEEKRSSFQFINDIPPEDNTGSADADQNLADSDSTPAAISQRFNFSDSIPDGSQTRFRLPTKHQHPHYHSHYRDDEPHFRVRHEASSIELFYDLFFVANLATFTTNHPIDDKGSLASYMGFFTLLWFTWFQTSIYDVRFSIDSVFSRVCKALHFGVMTGFAIVGPIFQTDAVERDSRAFRSLSLIMMVSRLILLVQYGTVLWFVKGYKRTILPVALVMATLFVAAMIFLGLTFAFGPEKGAHAQDGWYVTAVVEALLVLGVSSQWRILSFKHTHLVERVGLLTLIILGEGIIGMTKSVTQIMQGITDVTSSSIGMVICSIMIIYFLYMLYYDQIDHDRFGTIRQQIWALLHFPLHVGILLTVEGSSEFILWRLGIELSNWCTATAIESVDNVETGKQLIDALNTTFITVSHRFTKTAPLDYTKQFTELKRLNIKSDSSNATFTEAVNIVNEMLSDTYAWIFENLGVEVPEKDAAHAVTGDDKIEEIGRVFFTVFEYFFISAGCTLVLLSVMYYFGKKHKNRGELASIAFRFVIGVGLALIATMEAQKSQTIVLAFIQSPWVLPLVTLCYGLVIVLDNLLIWASNKHILQSKEDYNMDSIPADIA